MIDEISIEKLKKTFPGINALVFHRSIEYVTTATELFDILSEIPEFPIVWDYATHRWTHTEDLTQFLEWFQN